MKEQKGDVLVSLDSATGDGVVAERGNLGEDVMVDVVSADMVVDDVMEDVKSRVTALEKDEVAVSEEGGVEVVKEVVHEDVVMEESLFGDDKVEDGVSNEVVNAGTCEDDGHVSPKKMENEAGVDQTKKESVQSSVEATANDPGNGTQVEDSEKVVEVDIGEAADVDCVMSEKTGKDEILDSTKIPDSVTKVDEAVTKEGLAAVCENAEDLDQNAKVDQMDKVETEVGDSKMDDEPEVVKGEIDVMGKGDETELGFTKETLEQPVNSVQEVADGDHGSSKIPHSSIMASLGLEEDDVVVVDEGLEEKNEAQEVHLDNQSIPTDVVNVETGEANSTKKDESSFATVKLDEVVACGEVDEVMTAQKEPDQSINVNAVTDSSNPVVAAYIEPESATDEGANANQGNEIANGQHGVLPANSQFSYEDAHMDRGEDAGMDIDEVLGWKDEISFVPENEQKVDPTSLSNSVSLQQSCYFHPPENEGEFSVSDLVWGKVRSHPWWPGQIFDPSDASEKAMKHHKKDCFLVAYFGDRTFGWNDSTVLKPFRENFSQTVEHMNSEAFNNAVHCALEEVSRRVELGLTCSCIAHDIYENIKYQIVENSGIKQESSKRHGVDISASVSSFEPHMLVDYVRLLAKFPHDAGDKMELTMAKAQLSSYGRFKGHRQLAEFQSSGDLLEAEQVVKDEPYYEDGSKKRKALDSISDGSTKRPALATANPSFKVGGFIQRVASQLTGLPDQEDMLSQLHMAAQDPMKGYGFVNSVIPFFNNHRATILSKSSLNSSNDARKRKTLNENESEEFEFVDVNDSYWTDRIVQNYPEENQNGGGEHGHQAVAYEQEKPVKTRRSNKKRFFSSNHEIEAKEQLELIERRQKNLPTEVLMKFTEGIYFPSEIHLNKMFRRFGPLLESETEVDRQSGRARVVFKKCSDAEVAHSSAGKFNIFGSINVNYELNYTPVISYKPLPLPVAQDSAHAC